MTENCHSCGFTTHGEHQHTCFRCHNVRGYCCSCSENEEYQEGGRCRLEYEH